MNIPSQCDPGEPQCDPCRSLFLPPPFAFSVTSSHAGQAIDERPGSDLPNMPRVAFPVRSPHADYFTTLTLIRPSHPFSPPPDTVIPPPSS
ncbi:hypothetical protein Pmani_039129 [Petrolisthes manimaculis]|uniref:Uncharacterized protein n=1 Tax=Petrolisthes manimaculis TaxID=1843537 RepID=A0AAE1TLN6_9EUCA|nr:hypothetical protein Pmani_039129 [Petrolisthes manimaculis]